MNSIFHSEDIYPFIKEELQSVETELLIVSAFVKLNALKRIDSDLQTTRINKKVLVRFRKEDILYGSTDIELVNYCKENNWELFIDVDLHSKIFIFDKHKFCIGSANVTLSGLGLKENSNIETIVYGNLDNADYSNIITFFDRATTINDVLYQKMLFELEESKNRNSDEEHFTLEWSNEIKKSLVRIPDKLWVSELLFSISPYDMNSRDRALLGLSLEESSDIQLVRERLLKLKCYKWFINAFEREIYFGNLSSKLHNAMIDNPEIYRSEVKVLLSNLLNWIKELQIEEVLVDRPNYSQRIRKLE
ncbi:hypothetical protein [Sporosarcina ureae]|uniref:hypothetical protein n=1 Tax=Sporosarcina ureae TaxID=1571 RepID=UPI000A17ED7E|nr:hypothetical protein [Sporosarcina ureae]ARK22057.1 hypothetical protein SporoP32a_11325 [Sporosarcina ureae]